MIYAVFKEAVYRHECMGLFSTLERAQKGAVLAAEAEPDSHHEMVVIAFELDPEGVEAEGERIFTVRKLRPDGRRLPRAY